MSSVLKIENKIDAELNSESEKKINADIERMSVTGASLMEAEDGFNKTSHTICLIRSNELFQIKGKNPIDEIAGVYIEGIHYYDFKDVHFINNTGMASLIDLVKCLLEQDVKVQFVNVNERIKNRIKSMGLENILNCS